MQLLCPTLGEAFSLPERSLRVDVERDFIGSQAVLGTAAYGENMHGVFDNRKDGTIANLPGLECNASNERAALMAIVAAFKKCVAEHMQSDTPIPWIEPPSTMEPSEQQRSIPVHL